MSYPVQGLRDARIVSDALERSSLPKRPAGLHLGRALDLALASALMALVGLVALIAMGASN
jgi:hypothetical protein